MSRASRLGRHRLRRVVAQVTTVTMLLVTLGLTGFPGTSGESALAASQASGVGVAGSSGTVTAWGIEGSNKSRNDGRSGVSAVAVGSSGTSQIIKDDGTVLVGFDNGINPPDYTDVTAIAQGEGHTLVLHSDGTVGAKGSNSVGQSTVPAGLTGVKAIAAGGTYSLALKTDGTIAAWGHFRDTDADEASAPALYLPFPTGITGVVAISTSASHALALKSDGTIVGWGLNLWKEAASTLTGVKAISAGFNYSLALLNDGTVRGFGVNNSGQTTIPAGLTGVTMIAAGNNHALALKSDGTVRAWGLNSHGQTNVPATLKNVTAIAAGDRNSMALASVPPTLTADAPPATATVGTAFSYTFTATGGPAPTFAITAGALPAGLTLSAAGLLSGTPTAGGDFAFTVTADNGTAPAATGTSHTLRVSSAPVFTADSPPGSTDSGAAYSYTFTASGFPAPTFAVTAGSLPAGLSLTADGVLAGRPTSDGTFTVTASNGTQPNAVSAAHSIALNTAPDLVKDSPPGTATLRTAYSYTFTATGAPAPTFAVTTGALPDGLTLSIEGVLAGTPTRTGTSTFRVTASNGITPVAVGSSHTIVVSDAPRLTASSPPDDVDKGVAYSYTYRATGTPTPTFAVTAGALPDGLTLTAAGVLAGTPTDGGAFSFTVTAENGISPSDASSDTIKVSAAPVFTAASPAATARVGIDYSYSFTASGFPVPAYSSIGTLPAGLTLSSAGVLSGKPTAAGRFAFTITARNGSGAITSSHVIDVEDSVAPVFTADTPPSDVEVGRAYSYTFTAQGAPTPTFTVTDGALPDGLTLTDAGVLAGTTTAGGKFTFTVTAGNGNSPDASSAHTIEVIAGADVYFGYETTPAMVGVPYSRTIVIVGYPAPTAWLISAPPGLSYTDGVLSGTPTASGLFDLTIGAVNSSSTLYSTIGLNVLPFTGATPVFTADAPPAAADAGTPYSYTFAATGLPAPTFRVSSGVLPTGMTLSTQGVLAGSPPSGGTFDFTVTATNATGDAVSDPHTITVSAAEAGTLVGWGANVPERFGFSADYLDVTAIAAGDFNLLALKSDGTLVQWGDPTTPQIPSGLTGVTAIASGLEFSLALKSDGTVVSWGDNSQGQLNTGGLSSVTAIAAGNAHGLALKSDGTVVEWGRISTADPLPAGLSGVVSIAAGEFRSLAVKSDGTVVMWGDDFAVSGPNAITGAIAVAAGETETLVLRADGTVTSEGPHDPALVPRADLAGVTAIAAGRDHFLAVKSDGTVASWGVNYADETNVPAGLNGVIAVDAAFLFSVALVRQVQPDFPAGAPLGAILLGQPYSHTFTATGHPAPTFAVTAGSLPDGLTLGTDGVLSGTPTNSGTAPFTVTASNGVGPGTAVPFSLTVHDPPVFTASSPTDAALGTVYSYRYAATGSPAPTFRVSAGTLPPGLTLSAAGLLSGTPVTGGSFTFTITAGNGISTDAAVQSTLIIKESPTFTADAPPATAGDAFYFARFEASGTPAPTFTVSSGRLPFGLVLTSDGALIGTPTTAGKYTFTVTAGNGFADTAGKTHTITVADTVQGAVIGWGQNASGQTDIPAGLADITAVAGGDTHSLALRADGTVVAWGDNQYGQSSVPADLDHVVAIAAGGNHSLALIDDGTVVVWGDDDHGQLAVPAGLDDVTAISAGPANSIALTSDGTAVAWGENAHGESQIPTGLSGIYAIAAGFEASMALTVGGIAAWGNQVIYPSGGTVAIDISFGRSVLLLKSYTNDVFAFTADDFQGIPVPAGFDTGRDFAAGYSHAMALQYDATLVGWGDDTFGQATPPPGLTGVMAVATGANHTLAVIPAVAPTLTADAPPSGALGQPYSYTFTGTGTPAPTFAVSAGTLPAGLVLAADGTLSGTPTSQGPAIFTITADNGLAPAAVGDSHTVSITAAPVFTADSPPAAVIDTPYSYTFTASGTPAPTFTLTAGKLPEGLKLSSAGVLAGTPTAGGDFGFTVTADNGIAPAQIGDAHVLRVSEAPTLTADAPPTGALGQPYSYTFTATGTPAPTFAVSAGTLPEGLTLAADGTLSGTPTEQGPSRFTVTADNGLAPAAVGDSHTVSITAAPVFTADSPPAAIIDTPYSYTFTASGTPAPTFAVTAGTLPKGLTLSSAGVLSGTPTKGGDVGFTVTADNGISPAQVGTAHSLRVSEAPTFTADAPPTGALGQPYSYTFTATGTPAPTFTVSAGTLPAGLTLAADGTLSGTPTEQGPSRFTVTADNGLAPAAIGASHTVSITAAPVFTADSPPDVTIDMPYSYTFTASGTPAPTFTVTSGKLPQGLKLSSSGDLTGTPTKGGDFGFTVTADNGISPAQVGAAHILRVSEAPTLTADAPPTGALGEPYSYTFTATGTPAPTFAVSAGTLPAGLTLAADGTLSGTPTAQGPAIFTISADNGLAPAAVGESHTVSITAAPVFTADSPPAAVIDTPYSYTFTASGTPAPTFTVTAGKLPKGLKLSSTGLLAGTPTEGGDVSFTVTADNGISPAAIGSAHTVRVSEAPMFTHDAPPTGALGEPYSYTFTATGTPAPTFTVSAGTLPAGLTLAVDGTLSGTPTIQGPATFTITAGNGLAPAAVGASHTVTITAAPVFTADSPPDATIDAPYSYTFTATGTPAPTFTVTSGKLPTGLTLSAGGLLTGTPSTGGDVSFTVTATNGISPAAVGAAHTLSVSGAPRFTAASPPSAIAGQPYSYTFTASGTPAPTFTVTAGSLPAGLTLTSAGVLSGTPTDAESPSFTVTASNGVGADAVWVVPALLVNPGDLSTVIVAPPTTGGTVGTGYPVTAGTPFTFVIDGQDANGNPLPGQVATFTVPTGEVFPGTISGNTITFTRAGTHTITVQVGTVSTTIQVTVAAGPPAEITLAASDLTVKRGGSITLSVSGTDAYGNNTGDLTGQTVFTSNWSVDVIEGATITFPHASPHRITATLGTLTSVITVEVQEPPAVAVAGPIDGLIAGIVEATGLAATGTAAVPILGGALALLLGGLFLLLTVRIRRRSARPGL